MEQYTVMVMPSTTRTRVLVTHGPDELLRAIVPPPSRIRHERSLPRFLEGLSLLLDSSLRVVLCVDALEAGFCLGLTDEMGLGERSIYYTVEVVSRSARRRRGRRIRGVGDFAEFRRLRLVIDRGEP
jgi:hypothetical protein